MPARTQAPGDGNIKISRFKGLNLEQPPSEIGDSELQTAKNVQWDGQGVLEARSGWKKYGPAEIAVGTPYYFPTKFIGSLWLRHVQPQILVYSNGRFLTGDGTHGWTDHGLLNNSDGMMPGVQYKTKFYLGSGQSWSGTALATVPDMPSARQPAMALHDNRIFLVKVDESDDRMFFSEAGDPDAAWPALNAIDVAPGDGSIVQLLSYKNNLYVFKTTGLYVLLTGPDPANWLLRKVTGEFQFAGQTAVVFGGIVYVVALDGVYTFNGTTFQRISDQIALIFEDLIDFDTREQATIYQDQYIVYVNSGGRKRMFVYNIKWKTWSEWITAEPTFNIPHSLMSVPALPFGHNRDLVAVFSDTTNVNSRLRKIDTLEKFYDDNGTGFELEVRTKRWNFEEPNKLKRNRWNSLDLKGTGVEVTVTGSGSTRQATVGTSISGSRIYKVRGLGYTRFLDVDIKVSNMKNKRFELHGLALSIEARHGFAEASRV